MGSSKDPSLVNNVDELGVKGLRKVDLTVRECG